MLVSFWSVAAMAACAAAPISGAPTRIDRVVNGDTVWAGGVKYRIKNLDAPEVHKNPKHGYKCAAEKIRGDAATDMAKALLMDVDVTLINDDQEDVYGRTITEIRLANGRMFSDVMIQHGFARKWTGKKSDWCAPDLPE